MKTIYKITYFCGYAGTKEIDFVKADSLADAEEYAKEGLPEYISNWEHLVTRFSEECGEECGEACFYDSQEYEDYVEDCGFDIVKAIKDDFQKWGIDSEKVSEI